MKTAKQEIRESLGLKTSGEYRKENILLAKRVAMDLEAMHQEEELKGVKAVNRQLHKINAEVTERLLMIDHFK